MADTQSVSEHASTRRLVPPTDKQDNTAQTSNNDTRPSLWQKLKMENQERKAKEVQYVSSDQAENITGYGDERVKRGEEERKRKGEKSGNASFAAMMLS